MAPKIPKPIKPAVSAEHADPEPESAESTDLDQDVVGTERAAQHAEVADSEDLERGETSACLTVQSTGCKLEEDKRTVSASEVGVHGISNMGLQEKHHPEEGGWQPEQYRNFVLPRLPTFLKASLKALKESVLEVFRVTEICVKLPDGMLPHGGLILNITLQSRDPRVLALCRKRKPQTWGCFEGEPVTEDAEGCFRTSKGHRDTRVPRLARIQGRLFFVVTIQPLVDKDRPRRMRSKSACRKTSFGHCVRMHAPVPSFPGQQKIIELHESGSDGVTGSMKIEILEWSQVFDIHECRPALVKAFGVNEWRPKTTKEWHELWKSPWSEKDLLDSGALLHTMVTEMKRDIILVWETLFSQNLKKAPPRPPSMTQDELYAYDTSVQFLKRLYLCFAVCKVTYCTEANAKVSRPWRFPLASVLCHGCRVLIRVDGITWKDFMNFLLFGREDAHDWDTKGVPSPIKKRLAATHAVCMDHRTSQLNEKKLTKRHTHQNLHSGFHNHHLGLDLPIGGLGNMTPCGKHGQLYVGPTGVPFGKNKTFDEVQNGHMYIRWDDFGVIAVPVLKKGGSESTSFHSFAQKALVYPDHKWTQMHDFKTMDELKALLVEHGYGEYADKDDEAGMPALHRSLTEDRDLLLQTNESGHLLCQSLLVQVVFEMHDKDSTNVQVLTHTKAQAVTGVLKEDITFIDDVCVPTTLRRRHESWEFAVRRLCKNTLKLSSAAIDRVVHDCEQADDFVHIYRCKPLPTHCHHHMAHQGSVRVDFNAYRFHCKIMKNEHVFKDITKLNFSTDEECANLLGFSGLGPVKGKIRRQWEWLSMEEASQKEVAGLIPPQDGFHVIRETENISGLLIGIEGSAPGKESFFSGKHSVKGKSKHLSAFGKRKWSDYRSGGEDVPADLGGMRVSVDKNKLQILKDVCQRLDLCKPSAGYSAEQKLEKEFFQDLLSSSEAGLSDILARQFNGARVASIRMSGTAVLSDNVVGREDLVYQSEKS